MHLEVPYRSFAHGAQYHQEAAPTKEEEGNYAMYSAPANHLSRRLCSNPARGLEVGWTGGYSDGKEDANTWGS